MDLLDDEILKLWDLLHIHNVKYIMVGGFAETLYGLPRITDVVDLWIKDTLDNRKNLRSALKDLDIGDFENIETVELLPGWSSIYLNSGFELDIMTYIKGFEKESFDECYELSPTAIIQNIPIKFLHINKLIESKQLTNRPKDKIDIEELQKIKNQTSE